ncbi:MAG: homoserine O-acetyltransferase [Myxococcales bacterium]|nr:homoserine O-acetyltransferase [Myxococcales bacterium]MDH5566814.1 homoserine O-acetyltransferase [Myxococcales bacterium]
MARRIIPDGPEPTYDRVASGYAVFHSDEPFPCESGGALPELTLAYETWGKRSRARDNTVLLHTGLSASSHARSHARNRAPGWWEQFIGPGAPLDTDRYHVVCTNLLGGCFGSSGPASRNPETGEPYALDFPIVTVADMVRAQLRLLDHLGIERLHASIGASLGGMQSLQLAALAPERVQRIVSISATAQSSPQSIALRFVQRQAVMNDPDWREGRYYGIAFPHRGQKVAREIGTITYRSGPEWEKRFGRERSGAGPPRLGEDFQVESYLVHQGEKFCLQYDANSYLYISKAMDLFDLLAPDARGTAPIERIGCPSLVIGVRSDLLFPVWQQRELARLLEKNGADVRYLELDAPYGHDTFLIERDRIGTAIADHLDEDEQDVRALTSRAS